MLQGKEPRFLVVRCGKLVVGVACLSPLLALSQGQSWTGDWHWMGETLSLDALTTLSSVICIWIARGERCLAVVYCLPVFRMGRQG